MMANNALDTSMDDSSDPRYPGNVAPLSDDWYHGHKVVAMPSSAFGGMTIREVVSSRNNNDNNKESAAAARPRRSNSLGRAPIRPGRDIIQDVYDRMGVSYTRGMDYGPNNDSDSINNTEATTSSDVGSNLSSSGRNNVAGNRLSEKFSGRYRTAAAIARTTPSSAGAPSRGRNSQETTGTNSSPRGRAAEPRDSSDDAEESEGQRRARSLSRGRSVQGRWPPAPSNQQPDVMAPATTKPKGITESSTAVPGSPKRTSPTMKRSHSFDARPQYGGGLRSGMNKGRINSPPAVDMRDEKKECDDRSASSEPMTADNDEEPGQNVPSIKDRISVFAGSKSNAAPSTKSNAKSYLKAAPPKVNIYEMGRNVETTGSRLEQSPYEQDDEPPEEGEDPQERSSATPLSAAAVAAAEEASKYLRPSQMAAASKNKMATRHSTGSTRASTIANSYLSGIQQAPAGSNNSNNSSRSLYHQQNQAPVSEVPTGSNDEYNPGNHFDSNSSVGASSCGDNDSKFLTKKPSWRNYNNSNNNNNNVVKGSTSSVGSNTNNSNNNSNNAMTVNAEMIERMVEERVQTQLREVESRMEMLLRRWMDQMNNKITSRLDAMEASIKDSMPDPSWRHEI